jgi:hypothetical protein
MNQLFLQLLKDKYVINEKNEKIPIDSNIDEHEAGVIVKYIKQINASSAVEVGCAFALSSLIIGDALQKNEHTKHYIFDPHQSLGVVDDILGGHGFDGLGIANLKKAGLYDHVEFHEIESYQGMPELIKRKVKVDFVFIDGWHTFDYTLIDMFMADKLLKTGGIMVIDDSNMVPVREACGFFINNRDYKVLYNLEDTKHSTGRKLLNGLFASLNKVSFLRPYLKKEYIGGYVYKRCAKDILVLQKHTLLNCIC